MAHFPLFVSIEQKLCVIIGGGKIAERRAAALLGFGARLRLIAPRQSRALKKMADDANFAEAEKSAKSVEIIARNYLGPADLADAFLVFAATDSPVVNRQVADDARFLKIMVNVADDPAWCDFYFPAIVRRNEIVAGICTSGTAPAFAGHLRRDLDQHWSPNLADQIPAAKNSIV